MALTIGADLPRLTLLDQNGDSFQLESLIGSPFVVYFYPKDFTPGCTKEACSFRDNYSRIESLGAKVVGISNDTSDTHAKFVKRYQLTYPLLSDVSRKAEKAFGVERNLFGLLPGRETFIFDEKGKLVHHFTSALNPVKHVQESINALKSLHKAVS